MFVLLLVVFLVFSAFYIFPPGFILLIPLYRFLKPFIKGMLGLPTQFVLNFRPVYIISPIMSRAVFNKFNKTFVFAHYFKNPFYDFNIWNKICHASNHICLPYFPFLLYCFNC